MGIVQPGVAKGLDEFFRGGEGCVGRIGGQVAEKRLIFALFDKGHGFVKENVLPVAFGFHAFAVADEEGVKVIEGAADIDRALVETPLFGAGFVTQVPFSDKACLVPCGFQELGKKNRILVQFLTGDDGMGEPVAKLVHAGQEGCPGRRTGGTA